MSAPYADFNHGPVSRYESLGIRLAAKVVISDEGGCWIWHGRKNRDGYGFIDVDDKVMLTHRASYIEFVGPIPGDLTVDHLCFVTSCLNPDHLRLLTRSENSRNRRPAAAVITYCKRGHEFTPENTQHTTWGDGQPRRACRTCRATRDRSKG